MVDQRPAAIALPATPAEVGEAIEAAKSRGASWNAGRYRSFSMNPVSADEVPPPAACDRLRAVKAEHDPDHLFLSNQPISS